MSIKDQIVKYRISMLKSRQLEILNYGSFQNRKISELEISQDRGKKNLLIEDIVFYRFLLCATITGYLPPSLNSEISSLLSYQASMFNKPKIFGLVSTPESLFPAEIVLLMIINNKKMNFSSSSESENLFQKFLLLDCQYRDNALLEDFYMFLNSGKYFDEPTIRELFIDLEIGIDEYLHIKKVTKSLKEKSGFFGIILGFIELNYYLERLLKILNSLNGDLAKSAFLCTQEHIIEPLIPKIKRMEIFYELMPLLLKDKYWSSQKKMFTKAEIEDWKASCSTIITKGKMNFREVLVTYRNRIIVLKNTINLFDVQNIDWRPAFPIAARPIETEKGVKKPKFQTVKPLPPKLKTSNKATDKMNVNWYFIDKWSDSSN